MFFKHPLTTLLLVLMTSHFGFSQKPDRLIIVTVPQLIDTSIYEYQIVVRSTQGQGSSTILCAEKNHCFYDVQHDYEQIPVIVPAYCDDSIIDVSLDIDLKRGYMSFYEYPRIDVPMTSDTVHAELPAINKAKLKRKHTKKKINDFWSWDMYNSKILTVSYYQGHRPYGELMFSFTEAATFHDWHALMFGPAIGSEFNFEWKDNFILGPKIGYYFSTFLINFGIHAVTYTDFDKASLFLKPRIGINPLTSIVNISYEYGIPIGRNHFGNHVNTHQLSLNINIPLYLDD